MENVDKSRKLGVGIVLLSIINIVMLGLGLLGKFQLLTNSSKLGETNKILASANVAPLTQTTLIVTTIITVILFVSIFLILAKKSLGAYLFIAGTVLNYVYGVVLYGFSVSGLLGLILPLVMIILLFRKKEIFFK